MKKGWSVSSHISTIRPSGESPESRIPFSGQDGTVVIVDLVAVSVTLEDGFLTVKSICLGVLDPERRDKHQVLKCRRCPLRRSDPASDQ